MKRIINLLLFFILSANLFAQTDGISYQAVIIGPNDLELPGVDSEGNYLPSTTVAVRFTIFDSGNTVEFEEIQTTTTDEFGRINLIIGAVEHDNFEKISWDGTPKDLKVDIDFDGGNNFVDMSREVLTFVPYAYHRNITATGTLDVDDDTTLNRELIVRGQTHLHDNLTVESGNTALKGDLAVDGETQLNSNLNVGDPAYGVPDGDVNASTVLNGSLNVTGLTTVYNFSAEGEASFEELAAERLSVNQSTNLYGSVNINTDQQIVFNSTVHTDPISYGGTAPYEQVSGTDPGKNIGNYPLLVEGSTQGIAIKVIGNRRNGNNFISFWDGDGFSFMRGRIEGEVEEEFGNNADWLFDQSSLAFDIYDSEIDLGFAVAHSIIADLQLVKAANDYRVCAGLGTCVAAPSIADLLFSAAEVVSAALQAIFAEQVKIRAEGYKTTYDNNKLLFEGVTYASGAGDYAEYLMREHTNEDISFGDIVGLKGGKISKNTSNAQRMMVVSYKPIVLGNMPQPDKETEYEKVAFMGQVPVKVFGKVNIGDYIIPSGNNDGYGISVHPSKITTEQISKIVGVAWTNSQKSFGKSTVIIAVGLNNNDSNHVIQNLEAKLNEQAQEITNLKTQIAEIYNILSGKSNATISNKLIKEHSDDDEVITFDNRKYEVVETDHGEIVYWEITMEDLERGMKLAEEQMLSKGINIDEDKMWGKLKKDSSFRNKILATIKTKIDQQFHYHKTVSTKSHH